MWWVKYCSGDNLINRKVSLFSQSLPSLEAKVNTCNLSPKSSGGSGRDAVYSG